MFVLRKLLKLLLLPVAFVLFFMRWALETSVKLTEWAVGLLTLIVGAAIIYSIVIHRWGDLFLYKAIYNGYVSIAYIYWTLIEVALCVLVVKYYLFCFSME